MDRQVSLIRPIPELRADFTIGYRYSVHFTFDAFHPANPALAEAVQRPPAGEAATVLPVLDSGVQDANPGLASRLGRYALHHADRMRLAGPPVVVPGGERAKNDPDEVGRLLAAISARAVCRHSCVLAIGGGAVLDVAGYAAAIAHRGVRLVRMPTTVLAQGDGGIGVENGVNAFGKKNFVGCFAPPSAVVNDGLFLTTLPAAEWRAGMSEAVKVACLKDPDFFAELERDAPALVSFVLTAVVGLVRRCAELHLRHITGGGDPFEAVTARPLDFGHWAAHKLEQLSGFRMRHGEGVATGIAIDTAYAHDMGLLPAADRDRIFALLDALGLRAPVPWLEDSRLLEGLEEFREHLGGRLTVTLLRGIGHGVEVHEIDRSVMTGAVRKVARWTRRGPT